MTAFDRIERRLPDLLDEIGAPNTPDYVDDMLRATARTRQRPAWSAPERWLPMGVIARPLPIRPVPWRLFAVAAAILLLAAATLLYAGSRQRVPPPFGLARNGAVAVGTAAGDIVTVDPATGASTALVGGATFDANPAYLGDGRTILFDRGTSANDPAPALYMANADGTGARSLVANESDVAGFEVSPAGDRALVLRKQSEVGSLAMLDLGTGTTTPLAVGLDIQSALWRPNHDQLIVGSDNPDTQGFYLVGADGTGKRRLAASPYAIIDPTLSPDGRFLAYATWGPSGLPGRIRILDIEGGEDREITADAHDGYNWQSPQFSPDGTRLLAVRFPAVSDSVEPQVAVLSVADGSATVMGPVSQDDRNQAMFSPDGTKVMAIYPALLQTWLFDVDGSNGRQVPSGAANGVTWQRLAP